MNLPIRNDELAQNEGPHHHPPEEEAKIRDAALDETIAETFPASDPLSTIPNPDDDEVLGKDIGDLVN